MAIVKNHSLMGTLFLSFLSLVSIEYISGEFLDENLQNVPIIKKPNDQYASVGESVVFECVAHNATVTWLHEGNIIEPSNYFEISGGYLRIGRVTENLFGNYTCLVDSPRGTGSSSAFLFTKEPLEDHNDFNEHSFTEIVRPAGALVALSCPPGDTRNPRPNISSLKDGVSITPRIGMVDRSNWLLLTYPAMPRDSGNYTCIVCYVMSCKHFTYKVTIIDEESYYRRPSVMVEHLNNATAKVGSRAEFHCPTTDPYINRRWIKSTCDEIKYSYGLYEKSFRVLSYGEIYRIEHVSKKDGGMYSCVLSNTSGDIKICKSAYLKVVNDEENFNEIEWAVLAVSLPILVALIILFIILYRRMREKRKELLELEAAVEHLRLKGLAINLTTKSNDYV